jgi:hypothetical protein
MILSGLTVVARFKVQRLAQNELAGLLCSMDSLRDGRNNGSKFKGSILDFV